MTNDKPKTVPLLLVVAGIGCLVTGIVFLARDAGDTGGTPAPATVRGAAPATSKAPAGLSGAASGGAQADVWDDIGDGLKDGGNFALDVAGDVACMGMCSTFCAAARADHKPKLVAIKADIRRKKNIITLYEHSLDVLLGKPLVRINYLGKHACSASSPCHVGQGDCDTDAGCYGNLKCGQRDHEEGAPHGTFFNVERDRDGEADFCYLPPGKTQVAKTRNGICPPKAGDCSLGEGDCSDDADCFGELVCGQRDANDPLPHGIAWESDAQKATWQGVGVDFCHYPKPAPPPETRVTHTCSPSTQCPSTFRQSTFTHWGAESGAAQTRTGTLSSLDPGLSAFVAGAPERSWAQGRT